jgi:hypothetical protein
MNTIFTRDLSETHEAYFEHMAFAMRGVIAGVTAIVHSVFPFLFVTTSSSAFRRMTAMPENRRACCTCAGNPARLHDDLIVCEFADDQNLQNTLGDKQ